MIHLVAASLLWAFSFGLIKGQLSGLDPVAVACGRLVLATAAFAPLMARATVPSRVARKAMLLGMLQFGLMYVLYLLSYRWLPAWLVALFTIFTPLYVVLFSAWLQRRLRFRHLLCAALAVVGAGVVVATALPAGADWRGIVLLQLANLCFAVGQILFVPLKRQAQGHEASLLGWMYLGAALITLVAVLIRLGGGSQPLAGWHAEAWLVLLYLGLLPTGLGFYLWNRGAARVGTGLLAVANNLKVPLAVLVSWVVFGEEAAYGRVLAGLAVITGALFLTRPPEGAGSGQESRGPLER
jgi:drug/metabolite transporter (DMT)-like permease